MQKFVDLISYSPLQFIPLGLNIEQYVCPNLNCDFIVYNYVIDKWISVSYFGKI